MVYGRATLKGVHFGGYVCEKCGQRISPISNSTVELSRKAFSSFLPNYQGKLCPGKYKLALLSDPELTLTPPPSPTSYNMEGCDLHLMYIQSCRPSFCLPITISCASASKVTELVHADSPSGPQKKVTNAQTSLRSLTSSSMK